MRYLKKLSLEICIKLYHLVHLNFPTSNGEILNKLDMTFLDIDISQMISDVEIAYCFNLAHACSTPGQAPVLALRHYYRLEKPARDKHSSVLSPFGNNK